MKKNKEVIERVCKKCGWEWIQRNPDVKPRACPGCKSYKWDYKPEKAKDDKQ